MHPQLFFPALRWCSPGTKRIKLPACRLLKHTFLRRIDPLPTSRER